MSEITCSVTNLSGKGRRQRAVMGVVALAAALGGVWWVVLQEPPLPQRLLVAIPLFVAGLGLFQAQAST